jgi:predicted MFS family arabinose efflux permease
MLLFLGLRIPEQMSKPKGIQAVKELLQKLDILGFIFFAGSAIQLLLALQYGGNQYSWDSAVVIGLLCGAGGTLVVFAFLEYHKGKGAIIPLLLIRKSFVWCGCLVMFFAITTSFCASYYLPIYFQAIKGASPSLSGVYLLPIIISQIIFVVLSGSIRKCSANSIFQCHLLNRQHQLICLQSVKLDITCRFAFSQEC